MELLGKCPPEPAELEVAADQGFDAVELYLEEKHLDNLTQTRSALKQSAVSVRSVHTPHVSPDGLEYISLTDELAFDYDACVVIHSSHIDWDLLDELESLELKSPYGYENQPTYTQEYIEETVLARGEKLTFDVAHFSLAVDHPEEAIEQFLTMYSSEIEVVHLCDATESVDGVPFGEGVLDMERITQAVVENYRGPVVLEVMPEHQKDALNAVTSYLELPNETESPE